MNPQEFINQLLIALELRGLVLLDFHLQLNIYSTTQRSYYSFQVMYSQNSDGQSMVNCKILEETDRDLSKLLDVLKGRIDVIEQSGKNLKILEN